MIFNEKLKILESKKILHNNNLQNICVYRLKLLAVEKPGLPVLILQASSFQNYFILQLTNYLDLMK